MSQPPHIPVLLAEVLACIQPRDGGVYLDATFGDGGYSRAILDAAACTVWAIDRDPHARARADQLAGIYPGRFTLVHGCFGDMAALMDGVGVAQIDGVAMDFGVSSMQLDSPERGFSFRADGPLDMRMGGASGDVAHGDDAHNKAPSAADVVNTAGEKELADIIWRYGEERQSRRIARAIVNDRTETPFERTTQLAGLVRRVVGRTRDGIDPATRTFQALRIYVNDELGEIDRGLLGAEVLLRPGGRLAVVAFHSLEDRRVKTFLRGRSSTAGQASRHAPQTPAARKPTFRLLKKGAIKPGDAECARNPRARSARLRTAERTTVSPCAQDGRSV
ncbi:16S rRNA (cytosine(1402)-N(4))-methyltransferase RsmH [Varunaivibrio sulfuroxidans]|uniref:Ribosomal RNA small subunit methyltransferase H n=1 Tax=Varunaivibrio sulfuroxidans TaxID=1773489 RepID=A0A4R3J9J7_9PROT|nr:16S rRNA (cytosine(1402)-N(4))-methyltransferase RsmH [Varunaivibrio sulfuroxidans]TCS62187.1 16S rRNA (cytosine1402-N4)-methyltransferase [Varunaivibrio sulfuroxidans]WES30614.1 16S rRNA (cytosine(1402)-N(4))-methyltransferase RsmH [Varunaivibrio sulfuroxidans]